MHIVTFSALADFPNLLEAHLHAFPKPSGGSNDAMDNDPELIGLVEDALSFEADVFHANLTAVLETESPVLDMTPRQKEPDPAAEPKALSDLVDTFQTARKRTLSILQGLTDAQWARTCKCDGGEMTIMGLVHLLSAHDWDQLARLQRRLGACSAL